VLGTPPTAIAPLVSPVSASAAPPLQNQPSKSDTPLKHASSLAKRFLSLAKAVDSSSTKHFEHSLREGMVYKQSEGKLKTWSKRCDFF